ncbi:MAG: phosphonate ABC transporter, permease protein PhnE [Bradymonadaceae bacterium]
MEAATPQTTPVIELEGARLVYGDGDQEVAALDGIDLRVEAGQRVAVIGPSGSGKTSLVRVLGGLQTVDEGRVRVSGRDLADSSRTRDAARDVGYVFQEFGLVSELPALHNVLCGRLFDYDAHRTVLGFDRQDRRRAATGLERLGLGDRLYQKTSKLSGGEKQRVGIARLLAQSPELALLDEPVSNLDVHWAAEAMRQLDGMRDGEATIVAVLHDLAMVRQWADRVLLMRDGEVVYDGDPAEACRRLHNFDTVLTPGADGTPEEESDEPGGEAPTPDPDGGAPDPQIPDPEGADELLDRPMLGRRLFYGFGIAAFIGLWFWAMLGVELSAEDLFGGLASAQSFIARLIPPDLSVSATVFDSLVETIQMALIGTTLAAIVSLPLSVLAARNVSPTPVRAIARVVLNLLRTIPSIIWGLFFVAMVGLGPLPGILALTFYAAGYLGKFYYEGIESIATEPVQALRTMGASRLQQFRHGVFPQVLPLLTGYTLYMFEYNVRAASILGVVGAGGIGFYLYTYINNFHYAKATTALLMLLVVVTVIDAASSRIRRKLQE